MTCNVECYMYVASLLKDGHGTTNHVPKKRLLLFGNRARALQDAWFIKRERK
jgi:hypothetical protein